MSALGPVKVLALDIATTVGWAFGRPGDACPLWGAVILPKDKGRGAVCATFEDWLDEKIAEFQPDRLVYEAPLPPHLQGDSASGFYTIGLALAAEACAYRAGVELFSHSSQTIRTAVIGRAHLTEEEKHQRPKPTVKSAIVYPWLVARGWKVDEHNAADAVVVWAYATGVRHPRFGLRRR